jgi:hypothetical protein
MIGRFVTWSKSWQLVTNTSKEFVYLGSLMTPTNDVSLEIQRRIQTANRWFFGLRKHLRKVSGYQFFKTLKNSTQLFFTRMKENIFFLSNYGMKNISKC